MGPPDLWVSLHERNLASQVAPCGDIDSNGDPDHYDNSCASDTCGDVCVCESLKYTHLWCTSRLTARCVLKRACMALLAHDLAWPRPCRRKLEDGGGRADERMWVIDDGVVESTATYAKFAELRIDPCM